MGFIPGMQGWFDIGNQSVWLGCRKAHGEESRNCLHLIDATPVHDGTLRNVGMEGHSLSAGKDTDRSLRLASCLVLGAWWLCPEVRDESRAFALPALVVPEVLARVAQEGEEIKTHRQEEMELRLLVQTDDTVCKEHLL